MLVVVIAEGVAIALLAVLVLGLLRSHALILKALARLDENAPPIHAVTEAGTRSTKAPTKKPATSQQAGQAGADAASGARREEARSRALAAAQAAGVSGMGTASALRSPASMNGCGTTKRCSLR